MLTSNLTTFLTTATAKALATSGPNGINVVPVSMIKVQGDTIWLFDFFMNKTAINAQTNNLCALTAWTDMKGVQVKATHEYLTDGDQFAEAVAWVKEQNPARVVKGLLILTPTQIFDISPGGSFSADDLEV